MDWQIVDDSKFNMKSDDYSHLILHFFHQGMNASNQAVYELQLHSDKGPLAI